MRNGIIEDASKIWWDLRPSSRFPTLEMRVTDVCTRLEDAVCVAAMFVSILRMLYRIRRANQTWRSYPLFLLSENRWRAQRYGVAGTLFDFGKGELVPFRDLVDELLVLLREDAEALGCTAEIEHARAIVARGTSADRQVACFEQLVAEGASREEALQGRGRPSDCGDGGVVRALPMPASAHGERSGKRAANARVELAVCLSSRPSPREAGDEGAIYSPADMPPSTASSAPVT